MPVIATFLARDLLDGSWLMKIGNLPFSYLNSVVKYNYFAQFGKIIFFSLDLMDVTFNYTLVIVIVNITHPPLPSLKYLCGYVNF